MRKETDSSPLMSGASHGIKDRALQLPHTVTSSETLNIFVPQFPELTAGGLSTSETSTCWIQPTDVFALAHAAL